MGMSAEHEELAAAIKNVVAHSPALKGENIYVVAWDEDGNPVECAFNVPRGKDPIPWPAHAVGFSELAASLPEKVNGMGLGPSGFLIRVTPRKHEVTALFSSQVRELLDWAGHEAVWERVHV